MFCTKCGVQNAYDSKFCKNCGNPLEVNTGFAGTNSYPQNTAQPKKYFYRSRKNKKICGVCGGFAETFDFDPTVVRLVYALGSLICGFFLLGTIAYFIIAAIVPLEPKDDYYGNLNK